MKATKKIGQLSPFPSIQHVDRLPSNLLTFPVDTQSLRMPETGDTVIFDEDALNDEGDVLDLNSIDDVVVEDAGDNKKSVCFVIDVIPGAPDFVEDEEEEIKEPVDSQPNNNDPWNWKAKHGACGFLKWLQNMLSSIPKHSGKDTTGVERAISYFEKLNSEISKAMREDYNNEIDAADAEKARDAIKDGLKRLLDRLKKLNDKKGVKKASVKGDLVKLAETSMANKMNVMIPYMIAFVARICIEASVQGGKDMRETFEKLVKEYNLDKREKAQVLQCIKDLGFPLTMDRLKLSDGVIDMTDGEGELHKQYQA